MRGEKLVLPTSLIPDVLESVHKGHPGMDSKLRELRLVYWWPGLTADVTEFVPT